MKLHSGFKVIFRVAMLFVVSVSLAGCSFNLFQHSNTTVAIGVVGTMSGNSASIGNSIAYGVQKAVDQANASNFVPGYRFTVSVKNDTGIVGYYDPLVAAVNVQSLIGDAQVAGIIGQFRQSEMQIARAAPIVLIKAESSAACRTAGTANFQITDNSINQDEAYGGYQCTKVLINAIKAAGSSAPANTNDSTGAKNFRQAVIRACGKVCQP